MWIFLYSWLKLLKLYFTNVVWNILWTLRHILKCGPVYTFLFHHIICMTKNDPKTQLQYFEKKLVFCLKLSGQHSHWPTVLLWRNLIHKKYSSHQSNLWKAIQKVWGKMFQYINKWTAKIPEPSWLRLCKLNDSFIAKLVTPDFSASHILHNSILIYII